MDCGSVRNLFGFNCLPNLMEWKDNAKSSIYRVGKEVFQTCQRQSKLAIASVVVFVVVSAAFGTIKAISAIALPILLLTIIINQNISKAEPKTDQPTSQNGEKEIESSEEDDSDTDSISDIENSSEDELTADDPREALRRHITFCNGYLRSQTVIGTEFSPVVKDCDNLKQKLTELKAVLDEKNQAKIQELIESATKLKDVYTEARRSQLQRGVLAPSLVQDFQIELNDLYRSSSKKCCEILNS